MLPENLHPLVQSWFTSTYGKPTAVQAEAWPLIAEGANVLALAPTGSGKTLAAFLVALSRFADGTLPPDRLSVLYVSPLKALNEDIRRNLLEPLASLSAHFRERGQSFPDIAVATRSGDTPQSERRRFITKPPAILALTPESLAILLLNARARTILSEVRYVVLDEIHAVLGTKRGAFLACQIARLALSAGEFQRVALSATVNPPQAAADFVGGLRPASGLEAVSGTAAAEPVISDQVISDQVIYEKREVKIVAPPAEKRIDFVVEYPEEGAGSEFRADDERQLEAEADSIGETYLRTEWENIVEASYSEPDENTDDAGADYVSGKDGTGTELENVKNRNFAAREGTQSIARSACRLRYGSRYVVLIDRIADRIRVNRTTLVFTDARRRAERIAFLLNELFGTTVAFAHHGSLSKEVRQAVETRLAEGRLPCVVATGSLELGIDIGSVDEVILAGSPGWSSVALQRIGRAGHGVGMTSLGRLIPFHGLDLLTGIALAGAVDEREIESVSAIENPLDILAQIILALCTETPRNADELYWILRGFPPFAALPRISYDR
ncbi:MAG: DEAD/DEAH box helicase, partial [Spirochaetaceae bacterium]|nr:DEAD/DEAH box helicase [Spirochaetaceae bacterium]